MPTGFWSVQPAEECPSPEINRRRVSNLASMRDVG